MEAAMESEPVSDKHKTVKKVYMLNHCVFCVKKFSEPGGGSGGGGVEVKKRSRKQNLSKVIDGYSDIKEDPVPRFSAGFLNSDEALTEFDRIWGCLLQKRWMEGEIRQKVEFWVGKHFGGSVFWGYPAMCEQCGEKVERLHQMIKELVEKVREIRGIVRKTWEVGRVEHLGRLLGNSGEVDKDGVEDTLEFLSQLKEDGIDKKEDESPGDQNYQSLATSNRNVVGAWTAERLPPVAQRPVTFVPPSQIFLLGSMGTKSGGASGGSRRKSRLEPRIIAEEAMTFMEDLSTVELGQGENIYGRGSDTRPSARVSDAEHSLTDDCMDSEDEDSAEDIKSEHSSHDSETGSETEIKSEESEMESDSEEPEEKACIFDNDEPGTFIEDPLAAQPQPSTSKKRIIKKYHRKRRLYNDEGQQCDFCEAFVTYPNMLEHMKGHVGDYLVTCPNPSCPLVFSCPGRMESGHRKFEKRCLDSVTVNGRTKKTCGICGYETYHTIAFSDHLQLFHETISKHFSCPVSGCQEKFTVRQSVELHINRVHAQVKIQREVDQQTQKCTDCGRRLKLEAMQDHLRTEHNVDTSISCKLCKHQFSKWEQLVDHMEAHAKLGNDLECYICSANQIEIKFIGQYQLRNHYYSLHQVGGTFACEQCGKEFFSKGSLNQHILQMHTKDPATTGKSYIYQCKVCDETQFKSKDALIRHNILEHGEPPLACRFCEKTFVGNKLLVRHEREHRGIKKQFCCTVPGCGKILASMKSLQMHLVSLEHVGRTNEFICDICGKGFNSKQGLRRHGEMHKRERDWVCEECGESFKNDKILKTHKLIHTEDRPYECPICNQKFRQSGALHRHKRSHEQKGTDFRPSGPMKKIRKRVAVKEIQ